MPDTIDTIQFGAPASDFGAAIERAGAVIVENVLTREQVAQINAELDADLEAHPLGLVDADEEAKVFFGYRTKRLMAAVARSETYRNAFLENDVIWSYAQEVLRPIAEEIRISTDGVFEIHPGEQAQVLHRDGDLIPYFSLMGPDGPQIVVNMLIALTDITEDMGATRVIPGSHKWPSTHAMEDPEAWYCSKPAVPVTVKAGTMYAINGRVVHGGGANVTKDVKRRVLSCGFGPGWMMPEHAYVWSITPELARTFSPRLRAATCYGTIHHRDPRGGTVWNFEFNEIDSLFGF